MKGRSTASWIPIHFTTHNSSCGKVMFLQMSVCPQGVCIPACNWEGGVYPSMQLGRRCLPLGLKVYTPLHPLDTHTPRHTHSWTHTALDTTPRTHTHPLDTHTPWTPPAPIEMAIEAVGTHPTGIHYCSIYNFEAAKG